MCLCDFVPDGKNTAAARGTGMALMGRHGVCLAARYVFLRRISGDRMGMDSVNLRLYLAKDFTQRKLPLNWGSIIQ